MHCRFATSADFMQRLLPVSNVVIDGILECMNFQQVYSNNRWKGFPVSSGTVETAVYDAFYEVANLVHEAAQAYKEHDDDSKFLGTTEWVDYYTKPPVSQDNEGAAIRPGTFLVLRPSSTGADEQQEDDSSSAVGWLQAVVAVEIKRTDSTSAKGQLIGYLRRVLHEQLDRRFILGFTLGPSQMSVLVHDRSGVLATDTAIDIHKDPRAFIRMIAAFTVLPASQLGYDPSMQIYDKETKTVTPSYRLGNAVYAERHNDMQWQITLNNEDRYLTVKALSLSRAGFSRGSRSTITWAVIPMRTSENESMQQESHDPPLVTDKVPADENTKPKVFVLKQSWVPVGSDSEGSLYQRAEGSKCDKISVIVVFEEVLVNKDPDETGKLIRQGLESTDNVHGSEQFISRIRVRTLLATYGWPLRKFCSIGELIRTLRDAIEGHKHLYDHGVLHRDISAGNIIIVKRKSAPGKSDDVSYGGCLIDLDSAKAGMKLDPVTYIPTESQQQIVATELSHYIASDALRTASGTLANIKEMEVNNGDCTFKGVKNLTVQPDVIQWAASLRMRLGWSMSYSTAAVVHAVRFGDLCDGGNCSAITLSWKQIERRFDYRETSNGHGIGTLPYASGEIIPSPFLPQDLYFSTTAISQYGHDAVHDMESLFWVLIEICLTRNGASGQRLEFTDEAPEQSNLANQPNSTDPATPANPKPSDDSLHDLVWCLFDTGDLQTLAKFKRQFFKNSWAFNKQVLGNFHPSFVPLWPLVSEWYSVLRLAHEFHGYEYHTIHERSLALFDKFIQTKGSELNHIDAAGKQVLDARKADLRTFEAFELALAAGDIQAPPRSYISGQCSLHANKSSHSGHPNSSPTGQPQNKKMRLRY